tara:strand:- start:48 stop:299 length:252 start_codon:yes stop_codon:yes gene_type:complete
MKIKTTDAQGITNFLYPDMYEDMQTNNYYDEATNITYTNGIRSIYKYCKKHNFNFRKVFFNLYFDQAFIPQKLNPATAGLEII